MGSKSYEKEQELLQKYMDEIHVELNEENADQINEGSLGDSDSDDRDDEDYLEESEHLTDSEQSANKEDDTVANEELENQPSTSTSKKYFIGKDGRTKWLSDVPNINVRTRSHNLVTHFPGP
ncbi:uncharacterized protein LOC126743214 [Anthonomus grandis grandis]|uniref:uncharacterized protein LOC126743214 n=1 Tax=Anthonomus grandis grandis TaxID=2921223 RepID=UPI0021668F08|nr:uncharacterized protein LOC126743214 [Anthonomus grandis grandis]